jgi:predicted outer membrane repeat protein
VFLAVYDEVSVADLVNAAGCPNAIITARWQNNLMLPQTIVVGNGTELTITGEPGAVLNGGGSTQLLYVCGKLRLENLTLTKGYAAEGGGAVHIHHNNQIEASNCTFSDNIAATQSGGAIRAMNDTALNIHGCTFINNAAVAVGGAIFHGFRSSLRCVDSVFVENRGFSAGAVFSGSGALLDLQGCFFVDNRAAYLGGAVYTNSSYWYGTGVDALQEGLGPCRATMSRCAFQSNVALQGNAAQIYGPLTVTDSNFTDHHGEDGAALLIGEGCAASVAGSLFLYNTASQFGGAIKADKGVYLMVNSCVFDTNEALFGGAVALLEDSTLQLGDSVFENSVAGQAGGAVYCDARNSVIAESCVFSNSSSMFGGAMYLDRDTTVSLQGLLFERSNASAGGAIYAEVNTTAVVQSSSFQFNTAAVGGAIAAAVQSKFVVLQTILGGELGVCRHAMTCA